MIKIKEHYVHPEDAALDKELPLMQQLLQGLNNKGPDSDDELEEEEETKEKGNKKKGEESKKEELIETNNCGCDNAHDHNH